MEVWITFKLLVCGGRDFGVTYHIINRYKKTPKKDKDLLIAKAQRQFVFDTLDDLSWHLADDKNLKVISGGAPGVDILAIEWAQSNDIKYKIYHADWDTHKKAAGPIRNQLMLDSEVEHLDNGDIDLDNFACVAFPGGNGTKDMIRRVQKMNIVLYQPAFDYRSYIT